MSKNKFSITLILILIFSLFGIISKTYAQKIGQNPCVGNITAVKQKEMLETVVLVGTRRDSGSGVIIDCLDTETKGVFEYRVLTNAHVTGSRFISHLSGVDSITGRIKTTKIDTNCFVAGFNHQNRIWSRYKTKVVAEDMYFDLAILSFKTKDELQTVKIADKEILSQIKVFDKVFTVSCPLGFVPSPTVGIISQILISFGYNNNWIVYKNTAQIAPGSSGGGLFYKYNGSYYLIGIPYQIARLSSGQLFPHLASAISIKTAQSFIDKNSVSTLND